MSKSLSSHFRALRALASAMIAEYEVDHDPYSCADQCQDEQAFKQPAKHGEGQPDEWDRDNNQQSDQNAQQNFY